MCDSPLSFVELVYGHPCGVEAEGREGNDASFLRVSREGHHGGTQNKNVLLRYPLHPVVHAAAGGRLSVPFGKEPPPRYRSNKK